MNCKFCEKEIPLEGEWESRGWCDSECVFRFYAFKRPANAAEVLERNQAMEEIISYYRAGSRVENIRVVDEENKPTTLVCRLVLEVIEGEIQLAYCNHGPVEILVAAHGDDGKQIHLPRGKPPGPLVTPFIWDSLEVKLDPAFVQESFRRARE